MTKGFQKSFLYGTLLTFFFFFFLSTLALSKMEHLIALTNRFKLCLPSHFTTFPLVI